MTTFDEAECLKTNPFEGDFGSPGDKVLKDKIGTARKGGTCGMCRQEIVPGERVRLLVAVFDGTLMSYRWCQECCAAMAASWTDDGRAWEARVRLGDESSNTRNKGGFLRRIVEREKAIHCIQLEIDFIEADMELPTEERVALRRALIAKLESEIKEIQDEPAK